MSISRKLAFLLALALAALAVTAAPAFATGANTAGNHPSTTASTSTTVTPAVASRTGDPPQGTNYTGTETTAGTLVSDNGTVINCQSSDFAATVIEDGTGNDAVRVDTLTFGSCTEPNLGLGCTVVVTTLPANLRGDFETGVSNWTATTTEAATITCALGTVVCEASIDTTLVGTVGNSQADNTWVVDGTDNVSIGAGSIACGSTASWTQSWDITSPATYTIST
jgi:hypothetical protein